MDNRQFFCIYLAAEDAALLNEQATKFGVDNEQYAGQLVSLAVRRDFNSSSLPLLTHLENIEAKVTELLNRSSQVGEANLTNPLSVSHPEYQAESSHYDDLETMKAPVTFEYDESEPEDDHEILEEEILQSQTLLFEAINQRIPDTDECELWLNETIGGRIFDIWMPQIRTKLIMTSRLQPDTPSERELWQEAGLEKAGIVEFVDNTPEDIERAAETIASRWQNYKKPPLSPVESPTKLTPEESEKPEKQAKITSRTVGTLAQDVLARVTAKSAGDTDACYDAVFIGITQPAAKGVGMWDIAHGKMFDIEDLDNATGKTFYETQLRRAVSKLVQWGHVRRVERPGQLAAYRVAKPLVKNDNTTMAEKNHRSDALTKTGEMSIPQVQPKYAAPILTSSPLQLPCDNPFYEPIATELIRQSRDYVASVKMFTVAKIIELAQIPRSNETEAKAAILALHAEGFLKATERMDEIRYHFVMPQRADLDQYRRATQNAIKSNGDKLPGIPKGEAFSAYDVRRALGAAERHHAAICFSLASLSQMGLLIKRSKRTITNTYTIA